LAETPMGGKGSPGNMLPQFAIPYSTALLIGITSGISHCSVVCAPFVSTYIMGSRQGALEGLKSFTVFTVGKVFMCTVLGVASGYIGTTFIGVGTDLEYVRLACGSVLILVGLLMLVRPVCTNCKQSREKTKVFALFSQRLVFNPTAHLLIMGMAFATIPCPPMGAILLYSLQMPSVISSSIVMSLFGIGTAVSPLIIICALAGWFSKKIKSEAPQYRMLFQRLSGVILILLGGFSAIF
jgi:sulfite exporter TauE/SafE